MAEGMGFEPMKEISPLKRLAGARTRPLCDPSNLPNNIAKKHQLRNDGVCEIRHYSECEERMRFPVSRSRLFPSADVLACVDASNFDKSFTIMRNSDSERMAPYPVPAICPPV